MLVAIVILIRSPNVLLVVLSGAIAIIAQTLFEGSKRLKASSHESRKKWALPFLILIYCALASQVFFLLVGSGTAIFYLVIIIMACMIQMMAYALRMSLRTVRLRSPSRIS